MGGNPLEFIREVAAKKLGYVRRLSSRERFLQIAERFGGSGPYSSESPLSMFARRLCLSLFTGLLLLLPGALSAGSPSVRLVVPSRTLGPASTLEIQFSEPMVTEDAVGKVDETPPIVVRPEAPFTFTWLDVRRGVLQPRVALPLSTTFQLNLREGLKTAAGATFPVPWAESVSTPPMELRSGYPLRYVIPNDAPVDPAISLLFNVNVSPETAAAFLKFTDGSGAEVSATVKQDAADYSMRHRVGGVGEARDLAPWEEQFRLATVEGAEVSLPPRNQLTVQPSQPLPPGAHWKLQVAAGLPALEGGARLLRAQEVEVGTVQVFTVRSAKAENYLNSGRHIVLDFSKSVAKDVTPQNVARWISVEPAPSDLKAVVNGRSIVLSGAFKIGEPVRITVDPGLPCAEPMLLAHRFSREITFDPIPKRLYFEEFQTHQLSTGRRQFQLLGVNVPRVRVTAKLFQPDTAANALQAWRGYYESGRRWRESDDSYSRVEIEALPGTTVFEREYDLGIDEDQTQSLALNWDEILGVGRTGIVLITAEEVGEPRGAKPGTQALVQVTDTGLVWKTSKTEFFLYAFSLSSGQPLRDVQLALLDETGVTAGEIATDEHGVARMPANSQAKWVMARNAGDLHLVPFDRDRDEISLYRFRLSVDEDEAGEDFSDGLDSADRKAFLFSDRGVYRPGETVHIKGIARDFSTGASRVPAGEQLSLIVTDARQRRVFAQTVTVSESGAFEAEVALRPTGAVGRHWITLSGRQPSEEEPEIHWASHSFLVEEFTPNAFEVTVSGPDSYLGEASLEIPVRAQYYMGKPLSKARLSWTLRAEDMPFQPEGFGGFAFCDALADYRLVQALGRAGEFASQGQEDLSREGKAEISSQVMLNPKAPQPRSARLICEITDLNQQTVSAEHEFTVHSSDFYLGMAKLPGILREGEPLRLPIVAVGRDGTPLAERVPVTVRITRIGWQTNRVETAGRAAAYESEPVLTLKHELHVQTQLAEKEGRKWMAKLDEAEEVATFSGEAGQYLVEASARDAGGREVVTTATLSLYGKGQTAWNYRNPFQVDLVADKVTYRTGDTATLLVKTPIAGAALVTVERENVRRSFIAQLEGNAPSIQVPLEEGDAPNVFVSVMLLRGAAESARKWKMPEYRVGYAKLAVERPEAKLNVYVRAAENAYRPGDPASLTAEVLDSENRPVAGSEVTLYAVDEGVLSLTGYATPNPLRYFQRERALAVRTGLTLPSMLEEDPEEARFGNKGYLIGDKGGPDRIRKNFLACAFWAATLRTGADGKVTANFTVPDGLTRYRVMAVAQTARDQFGAADAAFEVNKPVMIEPAPPRFANVGDELALRAVLHNTTDLAGEAFVQVALDGTASGENLERRVSLPAHGSVALDFPVIFREMGEAQWTWSVDFTAAEGGEKYRDAAVTSLQVHYPTPARREVYLKRVLGAETDLLPEIAPNLLEGHGTVRVSVTNSRAIELREAMDSLLKYPYGCVEQTTSSTLPWMTLRSFRGVLPEMQRTEGEVAMMIERGVNRILSMQTSSGGLSYWPGGREPMRWASAYGGLGLAIAKKGGNPVPEAEFDRLCDYLSQGLRGAHEAENFSERVLALYALALAGRPEASYHEVLFQQRQRMTMEDRALLALAILESGGSGEMITQLLARDEAMPATGQWFGSESRQVAMQLLAWCQFRADAPEVEALVTRLTGYRTARDWATTQGNAWALLALSKYVEKVEHARAPAAGSLTWGAQEQDFALEGTASVAERSWPLAAGMAGQPLRVSNPQGQPLYAEVRIESRPSLMEQPRQDQGFSVLRTYSRVNDDGSTEPLADARVGDRVLVTLDVTVPQNTEYIAIEDPLPSLFEAIHPEFKTQQTVEVKGEAEEWYSDFRELRKDRALFFRNWTAPGTYQIRYLARVCAAGKAIAPSAKVEAMYQPERYGLSATHRLSALPLP